MALGSGDLVFSAGTHLATPFLDRLAPSRAAGFSGVSVYPFEIEALRAGGMPDAEIRARVADADLQIGELDAITTWIPGHRPPAEYPAELADALMTGTPERLCPMAAAVGARSLTIVEFYGGQPSVDAATEGFAHACDVAAEEGVLLHLEFLPWAGIPDLAAAWAVVSGADRPNGGILLDSWHFFRSGSTLEELARLPGDKVLYVQIDDGPAEPEADLAEETQHRRLLPGEGSFDLAGMFETLEGIGFAGPVGVEVFSDDLTARPIDEVTRLAGDSARRVTPTRD